MAINKAKKQAIAKELSEKVAPAGSVVFVNFHGLSVGETTTLRKSLSGHGIGLKVAKKTLIKRAFGEQKIEGELPALEGEVAMAFSSGADTIAAPREVHNFAKAHPEHLKILGGVFEGKYASASLMTELATIPSREVLLGKLLNLFNSPIQRFVLALDAVSKLKN